jgi:riboflavin synthase
LGDRAVGDSVNLEVDVVAKYVERLLAARPDYREDADGATPAPGTAADQEHPV